MKQLRSRAVEQKTLSSPLRMAIRRKNFPKGRKALALAIRRLVGRSTHSDEKRHGSLACVSSRLFADLRLLRVPDSSVPLIDGGGKWERIVAKAIMILEAATQNIEIMFRLRR
ncbi:MAG: hypothetical protein K9J42_07565 [Sulfuritalea sp.]|nr:hypothetical protein [Sulfuritalea sp.]